MNYTLPPHFPENLNKNLQQFFPWFATCVYAGIPMHVVSFWLGHSSITTTQKHYLTVLGYNWTAAKSGAENHTTKIGDFKKTDARLTFSGISGDKILDS